MKLFYLFLITIFTIGITTAYADESYIKTNATYYSPGDTVEISGFIDDFNIIPPFVSTATDGSFINSTISSFNLDYGFAINYKNTYQHTFRVMCQNDNQDAEEFGVEYNTFNKYVRSDRGTPALEPCNYINDAGFINFTYNLPQNATSGLWYVDTQYTERQDNYNIEYGLILQTIDEIFKERIYFIVD